MMDKWRALGETAVVDWLFEHWSGPRWGGWKLGSVAKGLPNNNNGLEATNR